VGSAQLARYAEDELNGTPAQDAAITAEIAPCFIDGDGRRTDTVVLACTHYPLLLDRLQRLAPWPVTFIDPAPAIARRVLDLIGRPGPEPAGGARFVYASGKSPSRDLAAALARFGIGP
jgi:glutamate racemase